MLCAESGARGRAAAGAAAEAEMAGQHRRILRALLGGRWDAARKALAQHIRCQRPVLKKMMARLASLPVAQWPGPRRL